MTGATTTFCSTSRRPRQAATDCHLHCHCLCVHGEYSTLKHIHHSPFPSNVPPHPAIFTEVFFHTLNLFATPARWVFAIKNECHHSADRSEKFDLYSSAHAAYKTQKYELRLDCKNLWGYNKREYKDISILGTNASKGNSGNPHLLALTCEKTRKAMASKSFSSSPHIFHKLNDT